MRQKANYPDWVLKYKEKGTYINFVKPDKYYLYAAHSERVKGTDKVVRVCDGYIGRITQKDGLILSKKKRPPEDNNTYLLELGSAMAVWTGTERIRTGLNRTYGDMGDWVYAMSTVAYLHGGFWTDELFQSSYLSVLLKDMKKPSVVNESLKSGIDRGVRMITDTMQKTYGNDLTALLAYAGTVGVIRKNNQYSITYICPAADALFRKYRIPMEVMTDGKD